MKIERVWDDLQKVSREKITEIDGEEKIDFSLHEKTGDLARSLLAPSDHRCTREKFLYFLIEGSLRGWVQEEQDRHIARLGNDLSAVVAITVVQSKGKGAGSTHA